MLVLQLLFDTFKLYYTKSFEPSDEIIIGNVKYFLDSESKENKGFIGFFDWLRFDESNIIGIRMCFFEHHGYNEFFFKLPYVRPSFERKCVEILFAEEDYNRDISGDQDFSQNYVYRSSGDSYLITLNLDYLTEIELESLLKYCGSI